MQEKNLNQTINLSNKTVSLFIKREDLIHKYVSGNKFRKLKYNLIQAKKENHTTILTFGGAFSNHIAAVAYAGKSENFKTIGIIRGDELVSKIDENPTLLFAQQCGMKLEFVSRETYRNKSNSAYTKELKSKFGSFYVIPEGGTNELAIQGCKEILSNQDKEFDYICCSIGTGGTIAGLINSALPYQKIIGFSTLKGSFLNEEISKFAKNHNWCINNDYHFGGYGKVTKELIDFINQFNKSTNIPLDPIYTGKMVFGIFDLIDKKYFPENSKILIIHSGGLQGIKGMNLRLAKQNLPLINYDD